MSFDISVLPKEKEGKGFLVLAPTARGRGEVVWHQDSWFEGKLYPDALGGLDRTDYIVGTIIDYAELPKENKQMKTQETTKVWGLQDKDGSFYGFTYSSRKRARVEKSLLKEWGCEARVVKVQIQVLN